ncbi:MAG: hypothetical protein H6926_07560 [Chromatiales bacterium]|nr:hypothetical protein [Gammaproteobacteria bacterium]MCP5353024.1 hypothetical protein [Chromatiales bacterium]
MSEWLVENFVWVGLGIVVVLVGLKVVIGAMLKKLMDDSAAANAAAASAERESRD